jgi:hypothetical protein
MQTPWAIILCKFSDGFPEPFPMQYYRDLFTVADTGSPWNMVRYFNDYSHGRLDLTGSQVFGWYQLTQKFEAYQALDQGARGALITWAHQAATDAGVDPKNLSQFFSTVVCTTSPPDVHDIGAADIGPPYIGVVAQGTTPIPAALGEEMGHVYGLNHSRIDGSEDDYTDPWDGMSAGNTYQASDSEFTAIGPGLNAWNMRSQHWLDESRVWKASGNACDETITLRPHVRHDLSGYLAAELIGGGADFLIEFRVKEGWDAGIPRPAVLVHRFEYGHSYLMRGNAGNPDLIAGDSFGDPDPAPELPSPFSDFKRVDVLSIDAPAQQATLRIRCHRAIQLVMNGQAVDPMYLILPGDAYIRYAERHYPHEPKVAEIEAALRAMTPKEQDAALNRARALVAHGKAVEEAFGTLARMHEVREQLPALETGAPLAAAADETPPEPKRRWWQRRR